MNAKERADKAKDLAAEVKYGLECYGEACVELERAEKRKRTVLFDLNSKVAELQKFAETATTDAPVAAAPAATIGNLDR